MQIGTNKKIAKWEKLVPLGPWY